MKPDRRFKCGCPRVIEVWTAEIKMRQRYHPGCRFLFAEKVMDGRIRRGFVMNRKDRRATHKRAKLSTPILTHMPRLICSGSVHACMRRLTWRLALT